MKTSDTDAVYSLITQRAMLGEVRRIAENDGVMFAFCASSDEPVHYQIDLELYPQILAVLGQEEDRIGHELNALGVEVDTPIYDADPDVRSDEMTEEDLEAMLAGDEWDHGDEGRPD